MRALHRLLLGLALALALGQPRTAAATPSHLDPGGRHSGPLALSHHPDLGALAVDAFPLHFPFGAHGDVDSDRDHHTGQSDPRFGGKAFAGLHGFHHLLEYDGHGGNGCGETPVPEPASLVLLGAGVLGLGAIGRKRD